MCLERKTKQKRITEGWKVFRVLDDGLYGTICCTEKAFPVGKWLNEEDYRPFHDLAALTTSGPGEAYPVGWHVFVDRKDAEAWSGAGTAIKKVKLLMVTTTGRQLVSFPASGPVYGNVQVCRYMKILPD
jgi:hypothetical protein